MLWNDALKQVEGAVALLNPINANVKSMWDRKMMFQRITARVLGHTAHRNNLTKDLAFIRNSA